MTDEDKNMPAAGLVIPDIPAVRHRLKQIELERKLLSKLLRMLEKHEQETQQPEG